MKADEEEPRLDWSKMSRIKHALACGSFRSSFRTSVFHRVRTFLLVEHGDFKF